MGEGHLRWVIEEFVAHPHHERNHEGPENQIIDFEPGLASGDIQCRERLGSLLNYYYREAA